MSREEGDRNVNIAMQLMKLGVSNVGVVDLMTYYPPEIIERQLEFLPFRKAKRPEAFIVEAVRNNYSPPKEFYYAKAEIESSAVRDELDQNPELPPGQTDAEPEGHGAESAPRARSADDRLAPGGPHRNLELPGADAPNRPEL